MWCRFGHFEGATTLPTQDNINYCADKLPYDVAPYNNFVREGFRSATTELAHCRRATDCPTVLALLLSSFLWGPEGVLNSDYLYSTFHFDSVITSSLLRGLFPSHCADPLAACFRVLAVCRALQLTCCVQGLAAYLLCAGPCSLLAVCRALQLTC